MKFIKRLFLFGLLICGLIVFVLVVSNQLVSNYASSRVYDDVKEVPKNKVGLLLGTGKRLASGRVNLFYKYRIEAAVRLYKARKIDYILVSGDNSRKTYDEPSAMKNDLIRRGVPARRIYLDYAGFRTFDSLVRCKEIFGQTKVTVISQKFHNERAIYIAKVKGIEAVGYNAKDVPERCGRKVKYRERLARVKVFIDLLIAKQPKYLGDPIKIK